MIDIKFLREHPDIVKENIKKKFQDNKLILVDEIIDLDIKNREAKLNGDNLRAEKKIIKFRNWKLNETRKKRRSRKSKSKSSRNKQKTRK